MDNIKWMDLPKDDDKLLNDYRELNDQGKEYVQQTMHMAINTYKKDNYISNMEPLGKRGNKKAYDKK